MKIYFYLEGTENMNKTALIQEMSKKTDMPKKDVEKALNAFLECVESSLINAKRYSS